jgi:2-C-methyl-D-erythritol 4-phosphate cytidylyltransferase
MNLPVQIVMGEETNLKITTPQDLTIAEFILKQRFID